MRLQKTLFALLLSVLFGSMAYADSPLWMRYPAISPNGQEIAFSYKGDIYKVSVNGGLATRLTTNPAYDFNPMWSPDGTQIAFVSDRHFGLQDIYVMNSAGGSATRVTTHSTTETLVAFSPDSKYIYYAATIQDPASSALFPSGIMSELYKVPVTGGRTIQVKATPVAMGAISKDGRYLLYEDVKGMENKWRKHHTSSVTRDIQLYDFKNKSYTTLVEWKGEDRNPCFAPDGNHFFFLSERSGTLNVFKQPLSSSSEGSATQLTHFDHHPVRFLSVADNGTLCFGYDGEIYTLREGGQPTKLKVTILNDLDEELNRKMTFSGGLTSASVSPNGEQIAFVIRGEVFVTSADYSSTKRITNTAAAESSVSFGGDNRSIVYESQRDGKSDIYIARIVRDEDPNFPNATLISEEKLIPGNDDVERMRPQFSPDGKEVAFVQDRNKIMIYNTESGVTRQVTDGRYVVGRSGYIYFTWSPDGKWLAMEIVDNNHEPFSDIALISTVGENNEHYNLTQSGYFNSSPRFVMNGNAIIYASEEYGMRNHASWGSMSDVMIVFLNREAYNKFRLNEEEYKLLTDAEKKAKEEEEKEDKDKKEEEQSGDIRVELENIDYRVVRLTPTSSNLGDAYITDNGEKLYYMAAFEGGYDLWVKDLRKGDTKLLRKLDGGYVSFEPDKEGKNLFFISTSGMSKMNLASEKITPISVRAEIDLNAAAEREYMFDYVKLEEAARFYVKDMHGVDWEWLTEEYRKFLPHINNNYDFSEMLSELLGELNVSHTGSGYRASSAADRTAETGLFFDLTEASDRGLKIEEVLVGGPFDTYLSKVKAGDFLVKLDGVELKADTDIFPLLTGKAGKNVLFTFYSSSTGATWDEVVKPVSRGRINGLLYERWVRARADEVDRLSNGRLGYVHISSMDDASFRRVFSDAMGKYYQRDGLVVDIRFNGGGRLHEDLETFLSGQKYLQQEVQGKYYSDMPSKRWVKPSVMVMCEADYSNAHGSPWVYKHMGIGKLVGMPVPGTMTSVNWVTLQDPSLYFGIPAVGYKTKEGYYLENFELQPDILVKLDFNKALKGEDTQMEAAVAELLR